ncbi:hypothetical protein BJV78DRAFT_196610 [Lactifluus subvellereus]|nr:hypothetical protein BJV78DRAFT_196610 [Lactifluus subvellereus]
MASNMRLNAFVWNRISQGYSRVVKDDPPQEQWQAWRRGHRESKPSPYRTPPPPHSPSPSLSPVRELSNEIIDEERGCPGNVDDSEALVVAAATSSSSRLGDAAAPLMRCATINDDADDMCYEDALSSTAVAGPLHLQEWSIPFLMPEQSGEAVKVASASGTECLRSRQVSFRLDAPENMRLTVVRCTFSRVEDVGDDFKTKLEVAYASKCSSTQVLGSSSASSAAC